MPKIKVEDIRERLTVTIAKDLFDFLDFLMIEKRMNKSAVVEHLLRNGIASTDDYYKLEEEFELRNYDMFKKNKSDHKDNKTDKTVKLPVVEKRRLKKK